MNLTDVCLLCGYYGVAANKFFNMWEMFGDVDRFVAEFSHNADAKTLLGEAHEKIAKALKSGETDKIKDEVARSEVAVVDWFGSDFPEQLRYIDDPPYILFCKGNVKLLSDDCLAVIGTRKVSSYGRRVAKDFTAVLCEHFTIVSGLAYGVDSVAHETTLENDGKTIAVLGGGVLNVYPAANQGLADRIVEKGGLLVSEYGINALPMSFHFPHRNRIVAGLSKGVLVCQAPAKSGTNSTVELALDQGKDIFVVPGEIYDDGFKGSNRLIKTAQAACVTSPRDILDFYGMNAHEAEKENYQMSVEEQMIVNALSVGPLTFDQLVEKTSLSVSELNFLLANLELRSIIARLAGNTYRLYGGIE